MQPIKANYKAKRARATICHGANGFSDTKKRGAACRRPFLSPSSPPNQGQILNFPTSCRNFHHFNALCFSSWTSVNVYLSQLSHVIFCRQIFLFVDKFLHQPQRSLISSSPSLASFLARDRLRSSCQSRPNFLVPCLLSSREQTPKTTIN